MGPSAGGSLIRAFFAAPLATSFLLCVCAHAAAAAQDPPDSVAAQQERLADSLATVQDSLAADSALVDSLTAAGDTLTPPPLLPRIHWPVEPSARSGVWEWGPEELAGARGQTLWQLVREAPGLIGVRGGDIGAPIAVIPVGYSGGAARLYWDGAEQLPLEGSIADLSRIPLAGLERVRIVRRPGGVDIHLRRLDHADPRAYSRIEVGTGDLATNVLRATFSMPRAVGGKLAVAIERLDTRGREDPGSTTGGWFRYSAHAGDRASASFELRRMSSARATAWEAPGQAARSDWTLHGRVALAEEALLEAWRTRASLTAGGEDEAFDFSTEGRGQWGGRLTLGKGPFWGRAGARWNQGEGLPRRELALETAIAEPRWGGATARIRREHWLEEAGTSRDLRAWFSPIPHAAVFFERGGGRRSVPSLKPLPPAPDSAAVDSVRSGTEADTLPGPMAPRFTDRSGGKLGTSAAWRGLELSGARIWVEADSVWPTQLPFDRAGLVLPQPRRAGWELSGRIPVWPEGLAVVAQLQLWEAPLDSAPQLYFPDHVYHGAFSFHRSFLESGNFELWVDLGAQGRAPMAFPRPDPDYEPPARDPEDEEAQEETAPPVLVPFHQEWYFRLQMRIISLSIFAHVENATVRDNNQDVPGRLLPGTRSIFGIRWTLWN